MPSPAQLRKAYGLELGLQLGSWRLASLKMRHVTRAQFERYEFPTIMNWSKTKFASLDSLKEALNSLIGKNMLIYSEQGSPYDCSFETLIYKPEAASGTVTVSATAKAARRRDTPTQAQIARLAKSAEDKQEEESLKKKLPKTVRVIKSRFGTGKCTLCGGSIGVGETIAKTGTNMNRGGWSHLVCAINKGDTSFSKKASIKTKTNMPRGVN